MAQQQPGSSRVKAVILLLALVLGMYIVGPQLYWQLSDSVASTASLECPLCTCDCSTSNLVESAVASLGNFSLEDCGREDPSLKEEMDKSRADLLAEELKQLEMVAQDDRQRAELALVDAKKVSSQYQKEAEKCNIGMETSEEAREKAEAVLQAALKASALWEKRARELGWTDAQI